MSPSNATRLPYELGLSPSPPSMIPALTSSSLNRPIASSSSGGAIRPCSLSSVAFTNTSTRIVNSPSMVGPPSGPYPIDEWRLACSTDGGKTFSRCRSGRQCFEARLQDDLGAGVLFVVELPVPLGPLVERQTMADEEGRIDLALGDRRVERTQVALHVGLAGPERQALLHQRAERKLVEHAAVDPGHRNPAALACGKDHLPDPMAAIGAQERRHLDLVPDVVGEGTVRFQTDAVDRRVGADPAGHVLQRLVDLALLEIDRLGAEPTGQLEPMMEVVDRDDPLRPHEERRLDREQANRTAAPHRHRVSRLD